jgi:hypothetical protein
MTAKGYTTPVVTVYGSAALHTLGISGNTVEGASKKLP